MAFREELAPHKDDYQRAKSCFLETAPRSATILKIEEVQNSALEKRYKTVKDSYQDKYGKLCAENFLFHGTRRENIDSILSNNLEVERYGQNVGARYGAGVSFSRSAFYASRYCDEDNPCTMLLCRVLTGNIKEVKENTDKKNPMTEPPMLPDGSGRYDTTGKYTLVNGIRELDVAVKFEQDSYIPQYVITFNK